MKNQNEISDKILEIIKRSNPDSVDKLIQYMEQELKIPKVTALEHVIRLENEGKLKLTQPLIEHPTNIYEYLRTSHALWFWYTMILTLTTAVSVFIIPEKTYPLVYIRYILGSIFVLFLPGYTLIKTLFPTKEIDNIERITLSIGTSLTLVPLTGLLLNYTPWGISLTPITLSLLLLTFTFAISGLIREHQEKLDERARTE